MSELQLRWVRVSDEPFEYAFHRGPRGDDIVRLLDGTFLRRAIKRPRAGRYGLQHAVDNYWNAKNPREEQAAYHEMLLFGGSDGYLTAPPFRAWLARTLRRLALWVEAR